MRKCHKVDQGGVRGLEICNSRDGYLERRQKEGNFSVEGLHIEVGPEGRTVRQTNKSSVKFYVYGIWFEV